MSDRTLDRAGIDLPRDLLAKLDRSPEGGPAAREAVLAGGAAVC